ncbi:MAG: hypothetical protein IPJ71_12165 [Bdellovibrionales bacterium]|nr:hypothetical protein [Bdellovibrionales bacterium]
MEFRDIVEMLRSLIGARLQKVYSGSKDLVLELYIQGRERWIWVDLEATRPFLTVLQERPHYLPKIKNPTSLFLHAHAVNRSLAKVEWMEGAGRVLRLVFGNEASSGNCELEVRLFPHGQNVGISSGDKKIWWSKPKILVISDVEEAAVDQKRKRRDHSDLRAEWVDNRPDLFLRYSGRDSASAEKTQPNQQGPFSQRTNQRDVSLEIEKRRRIASKIRLEIERKIEAPWAQLGEWLKVHQNFSVPTEWAKFIDRKMTLAENIGRCFKKAKETQIKLLGTQERLTQILGEIGELESGNLGSLLEGRYRSLNGKSKRSLKEPDGERMRVRKRQIGNRWLAYVGRSARDNLSLLRKARAWDLWLHLRDFPGSFCIVHRNKEEVVTDVVLKEAAQWMAQETFGAKASERRGERLAVAVAECRYVRPIKGDTLGRVTYQKARHLEIVFQ